MKIDSARIVDGQLVLTERGHEFYLADGVYSRNDGQSVTVEGHRLVEALNVPDVAAASARELENYVKDLDNRMSALGDDAQLASVDLQNVLQKQQQTLQMMSNISKMLHDTAMAVIRKIG